MNAPQGAQTLLFIDDGSSLSGAGMRTEILPESDQYMRLRARAIEGPAPGLHPDTWGKLFRAANIQPE